MVFLFYNKNLFFICGDHVLNDETTKGQIITRNATGWKILYSQCHIDHDFVLVYLKTLSYPPIFVFPEIKDKYVSKEIIHNGIHEGYNVNFMIGLMKQFPNAVFIDIGANVGPFSIPIAALGYRVIAIESLLENVMRLCASMKKAKLDDRLTIVYNALTDMREKVAHVWSPGYISLAHISHATKGNASVDSTILDDLLEIYNFTQVIMRIDVRTKEDEVLNGAHIFFQRVRVERVLLNFASHRYWVSGRFIARFMKDNNMQPDVSEKAKDDFSQWNTNYVLFIRHRGS